jgi:ferritin-like metal-binding protein YciE
VDGIFDDAFGAAAVPAFRLVGYADLIEGAEMLKLRKAVKLLTENRGQEVKTARKLERASLRLAKAAA